MYLAIQTTDPCPSLATLLALQERIADVIGEFLYWTPTPWRRKGEFITKIEARHCEWAWRAMGRLIGPFTTPHGVFDVVVCEVVRCKEEGCSDVVTYAIRNRQCRRHGSCCSRILQEI
jgi:hypothetical protein